MLMQRPFSFCGLVNLTIFRSSDQQQPWRSRVVNLSFVGSAAAMEISSCEDIQGHFRVIWTLEQLEFKKGNCDEGVAEAKRSYRVMMILTRLGSLHRMFCWLNYKCLLSMLTSLKVSDDETVIVFLSLYEKLPYSFLLNCVTELHSNKCLDPLFHKVLCYNYDAGVYNKHAAVRAKAAEVVTTMVQNNPSGQRLVMEVNGLQPLLYNFISDPDVTACTKALIAISSLIRNNKPGITAFLQDNGYAALRDALSSESAGLQREALNLIQYLLHENSSDCNIVTQLGFPRIMMHLTSSDAAQVREAALRGLLVLARDEGVRNDDKLKQVLQERIEGISAMALEDLGAAKEERQLVDSLWNACYNEPSSLGEKGLLVLPGC